MSTSDTSILVHSVASATSHRDRDDIHLSITRLLLQFLGANSVAVYQLVDDAGIQRVMRRAALSRGQSELGPDEQGELSRLPPLDSVAAWNDCVSQRSPVQYTAPGGHACNVFPISGDRDVNGLLAIETPAPLPSREAELVAGILQIIQNHVALLEYGERDTLTGLKNRKSFDASFDKVRFRIQNPDSAPDKREPSWLGMMDIDKFKSVNDTYGHLFGDEVLLLVAQLMTRSFRGADQLFRFGGEEFVILLDQASVEGAEIAFERLRAAIEAYKFPQIGTVTISLGYTRIRATDAPGECAERADAALYYAKHHGRNNIRCHEVLNAAGKVSAKPSSGEIELF
jgi:diguanylate cyclase (GGDEF)-like protein